MARDGSRQQVWLPIPSEPALDALFADIENSNIGEHIFKFPFFDFGTLPAPAKAKTLAGLILRNLAYAPNEERYDILLRDDAKRKAGLVKAFAENQKREFETAIKRIES